MADKGIFTALSGAIAQSSRLDTIANNIANVNTTAFKKDKQIFNEYLTANEKGTDVIQVPKVPASIESFYDMQGGDKSYVDASATYTDFSQGSIKPTGNQFDLAVEGNGFFEVLTPQGVRFTKNGALKMNAEGKLVNREGHPILLQGQGAPEQRQISVENGNITVSYSGEVYSGGQPLGRLAIVEFEKPEGLQKTGGGNFKIKDTFNMTPQVSASKVHQGFIESSNVNVVEEMTDMIAATRTFQSTQEAIKAFDSMNDKLVNVVPKA